jgi:recombination protein RecA
VKVVKNKVAPPFAEAEFDIYFNQGIDRAGGILDVGVENGVIDKKGSWLQFRGELIGQGRESARQALLEKPELASKILQAIDQKRNPEPPVVAP